MTKQKKITLFDEDEVFKKAEEVFGDKEKALQDLMFNNKSANKRKKNKDYYKNKKRK